MSAVKLVTIFTENKLGQLARITKILFEAGVNIRWVNIATSDKFGVVRCLVDKRDLAFEALKQKGLAVSLIEVLAIEVKDQPGALYEVANCLAEHSISIQNSSGFVSHNRAVLIIEFEDIAQARKIVLKQKLHLLSQEEVLTL